MRRRTRDDGIPSHLARFAPADWPGDAVEDAFALWRAAREAHSDSYGWPGGALDRLAAESDVRAVVRGGVLLPWDRTPPELEAVADRLGRLYGRRPSVPPPRRSGVPR